MTEKERHPKGLYVLFATEMWERFGFYTMIAMLTLYLQDPAGGLGWTKSDATGLYSNYQAPVYFTPLFGGLLADRLLGFRKTISIGGTFFILGYAMLTVRSERLLYVALAALIIGNGCFKPNISSLVGQLYRPGSPLRDSAYSIFYMGINIGALLAPLAAETFRQRYGFNVAFGLAAGGMVLGMIVFWTCQRFIVAPEKAPPPSSDDPLADSEIDRTPAIEKVPERTRVGTLFVIFGIVIVFWMIFHQNGSTLTYWADKNTDWQAAPALLAIIRAMTLWQIDVNDISGVISAAINPFWIIVLSIPLVKFWGFLHAHGLEPSTPAKIGIGMLLTCGSFLILYIAAKSGGDTGKVSPWWLVAAYLVLSLGELMLSPMGLSLVSKVAPARMKGALMGCWFVATAIGNKLTMIGKLWDVWPHSQFFLVLAMMALGMAIVLFILLRPLKKAMPGV